MAKKKLVEQKTIVICHGACEQAFVRNIAQTLKIRVITYTSNNGKSSIQINGLAKELNSLRRKNPDLKKKIRGNLNIFILMDLDDVELTSQKISDYRNGVLFKDDPLKSYITPLFNDRNFDEVLNELGYKICTSKSKPLQYDKLFKCFDNNLNFVKEWHQRFSKCNSTNVELLLKHFLWLYENRK